MDFHIHSTFSDGKLTIPEIVDLYGKSGFGAIAITDHLCSNKTVIDKFAHKFGLSLNPATYQLYIEIIQSEAIRAWSEYRMLVMPGVEISQTSLLPSQALHIVALGVDRYINPNSDVKQIIADIQSQGGLSVAAHPVSTNKFEPQTLHLWNRRHELHDLFDAWEVASGQDLFTEVLHSDLPKIANSDFHHAGQMTSWKTVAHCEKHPQAIFSAIRNETVTFKFVKKEDVHGIVADRFIMPGHCCPFGDAFGDLGLSQAT